jgi:predicted DNA-binding transcriptional regulator AlpA
MPTIKIGRLVRWTQEAVDDWVIRNTQRQSYHHPKKR